VSQNGTVRVFLLKQQSSDIKILLSDGSRILLWMHLPRYFRIHITGEYAGFLLHKQSNRDTIDEVSSKSILT